MRQTAERTAALEQEVRTRQEAETDARNSRAATTPSWMSRSTA